MANARVSVHVVRNRRDPDEHETHPRPFCGSRSMSSHGAGLRSTLRRFALALPLVVSIWLSLCNGRVPAFLSPTVARTLYFKLPIDGTHFHWTFLDRRAFLAGTLTLRIVNTSRGRDETLVVFREGRITDGWTMIGETSRDSSFYFGFSTDRRFATSVGDSVIVTLVAPEPLRGRGPYSSGTLAAGTWVATGTYGSLYGGTLNPFRDVVRIGKTPIAFLNCWDTAWVLQDARDTGWMGPKPPGEDEVSFLGRLMQRGVDGRDCRVRM